MPELQWWKIRAELQNAEENSYLLFELGVSGLQIISETEIECFLQSDAASLAQFTKNSLGLGICITELIPAEDQNWLAKCEEIWTPVVINNLRIIPVMSAQHCPAHKRDGDIFLIPGEGFGTGHHATTGFIIEILQSINYSEFSTRRALDLGCGSGILALAIEKLSDLQIDAVDNDPSALRNASDNLKINNSSNIRLSGTDLSNLQGKYGLIAANIYAEVLISMKAEFDRIAAPGAKLILSGIMSGLSEKLTSEFNEGWTIRKKMDSGEWVALLLTRDL